MLGQRPFCNSDAVHAAADSAWIDLGEQDYLEAVSYTHLTLPTTYGV